MSFGCLPGGCFKHVQLGGDLRVDPGLAEEIKSLGWHYCATLEQQGDIAGEKEDRCPPTWSW